MEGLTPTDYEKAGAVMLRLSLFYTTTAPLAIPFLAALKELGPPLEQRV